MRSLAAKTSPLLAPIAVALAALTAAPAAFGQSPPPPTVPPAAPAPAAPAPAPSAPAPYILPPPGPGYVLVPLPPPVAPPPARSDAGQVEGGFVLEATLGGRFGLASFANAVRAGQSQVGFGASTLQAGFLAGFKSGRLIVGLGLDFFSLGTSAGGTSTSEGAFLVGPEAQVALVRSDDLRVELVLDAGISLGHVFFSGNVGQGSNLYIGYELAPGLRYWLHRQFAVQALSGVGGEVFVDLPPAEISGGNVQAIGLFTSLGLIGVF